MDVTEKILKLGALGWDGKEPELDFFERVYGLETEVIFGSDLTIIVLFCCGMKNTIRIKKRKKIDLVRYCLRLFRTKDGIPEGPSVNFFFENNEWT